MRLQPGSAAAQQTPTEQMLVVPFPTVVDVCHAFQLLSLVSYFVLCLFSFLLKLNVLFQGSLKCGSGAKCAPQTNFLFSSFVVETLCDTELAFMF